MANIRPATIKDMRACEELFRLPELKTASGEYLSTEFIVNYISDDYFLVAEDNGLVVGAIYGEELKAGGVMIWLFAIKPELRGQGIGSELIEQFEANSRKNKRHWLYLDASTKDEGTLNFYLKHGFKKGTLSYECAKDLI